MMKDITHAITPPIIKEKEAHGIQGFAVYELSSYSWTT